MLLFTGICGKFFRAGFASTILFLATVINVFMFVLIHIFSRERKRAHSRNMYYGMKVYSWFLYLIWWIDIEVVKTEIPKATQYILTSNHISYLDIFVMARGITSCLPRETCETMRLIYWEELNNVPVLNHIFKLTGCIPIQMAKTNDRSLENQYDKESVKQMYREVEYALKEEGLSIGMSFEGRRNNNPGKLNKIQKGMWRISDQYNVPVIFFRLQGVDKIWPIDELPHGAGKVTVELFPDTTNFAGQTYEQYQGAIRQRYEKNVS